MSSDEEGPRTAEPRDNEDEMSAWQVDCLTGRLCIVLKNGHVVNDVAGSIEQKSERGVQQYDGYEECCRAWSQYSLVFLQLVGEDQVF